MASNTRGRIKEHFEGIHKNFDWILYHCVECLKLIAAKNPALTTAINALAKGVKTLDDICMELYSKL